MNIKKMQGNPAFLDVCRCSKEPQKYVVLSLSRLKHGFDCSAALQVSPGSHLCSYAPLRSFLARGRPFRRCRRSSPCRRDLRTETIGPASYFRVYIPGSIPRWSAKARIPGSGRGGCKVIATVHDIRSAQEYG